VVDYHGLGSRNRPRSRFADAAAAERRYVGRAMADVEVRSVHWGRALVLVAALCAAAQGLILLRRGDFNPVMAVVMGVGLLFILVYRSRIPLLVRDGTISGPDPSGFRSVEILLRDIDRARSAKPGLFGARTIWSNAGQAVHLDPTVIPGTDRHRVLSAAGLE
jgi:hypothetical protein